MMRGDGRGTSPIHVGIYRPGSSVLIEVNVEDERIRAALEG